ncbi:MAG: ACT domain-containing protein [Desulfobacterales bacterium]
MKTPIWKKWWFSGVTHNKNEARITLKKVPDTPGIASRILSPISDAGIIVDMIIQNTRSGHATDLTFTVGKADYKEALKISEKTAAEINAEEVVGDENIAKISITGVGMRSHFRGGRQNVRHPGSGKYQYSDDQHLGNQDIVCN